MTKLNFETDIEIDPDALDVECLRHATLYYKYSKHEAEMKKLQARAHETLKTIRSGLVRDAAHDPKIKNATQIEAFYRNDTEYQEAKQDLIDADYEANMASAALWAFNTRKHTLENLVKLALADYFARPSEPRNLRDEFDSREERETKTQTSRKRARQNLRK